MKFDGVNPLCDTLSYTMTLADVNQPGATQTSLGSYSGNVSLGGTTSFTVPVNPGVDAEVVEALSLVIQG